MVGLLNDSPTKSVLRLSTAGSVDDGKSSLIGRLLYDTKSIFEDQLVAVERSSARRGSETIELALLTDGLRAEREQNITIDVAYRYFETPARKFIIADTPGHEQYTRNMVTGTSTSDLSIILIDARKGVLPQSKRHAAISGLLGVSHILVAINKMDLVDFSEKAFRQIVEEFKRVTASLNLSNVSFIPISALLGDNVVEPSRNMPWYSDPPLLSQLEGVKIYDVAADIGLRFPVQTVIRPDQDFRGLAGQIEAGTISVGDSVRVMPSGRQSTVQDLLGPDGPISDAGIGDPVVVALADHIDVSRGEILVSADRLPVHADRVEAIVCWMHEKPLKAGSRYVILHACRAVVVHAEKVLSRLSIEDLTYYESDSLQLNDIGRVVLQCAQPLYFDPYSDCKSTGSFVFTDIGSSVTVGAGMLQSAAERRDAVPKGQSGEVIRVAGGSDAHRRELADGMVSRLKAFGFASVTLDEAQLSESSLRWRSGSLESLADYLAEQGLTVVVCLADNEPALLSIQRRPLGATSYQSPSYIATGGSLVDAVEAFLGTEWSPAI